MRSAGTPTTGPPLPLSNNNDDRPSRPSAQSSQSSPSSTPRPALQHRPGLSNKRTTPSSLSQISTISPPPVPEPTTAIKKRSSPAETRVLEGPSKTARSSTPIPVAASLEQLREAVKSVQGKSIEKIKAQVSGSGTGRRSSAAGPTEQSMSPSLEAAFASPLGTGGLKTVSTTSTESSTESVKTVKGTSLNTPGDFPARTPSYPFPYVPSAFSHGLLHQVHQPFTALSPTGAAHESPSRAHAFDKYNAPSSQNTTPMGQPGFFGPESGNLAGTDTRSQFQGPNLYDVVLQLNTDPNLRAWWTTLTSVLHDYYKVDRASLALPADTTDIENVPWGQKALFNAAGLRTEEWINQSFGQSSTAESETSESSSSRSRDADSVRGRRAGLRPNMETRHSFAGYEYGRHTASGENARMTSPAVRPPVMRSTTHHPASQRRSSLTKDKRTPEVPAQVFQEMLPEDDTATFYDRPDSDIPASAIVLPLLRALDREDDALLDSGGVNRILQRGRLVTLTRDYSSDNDQSRRGSADVWERTPPRKSSAAYPSGREAGNLAPGPEFLHQTKPPPSGRTPFSRKAGLQPSSADRRRGEPEPYFEEYEQLPTSPWAQSPAPSPAIQKDSEQNPFFVTGTLDEETFSPSMSPATEDYSKFQDVPAIGVDKASTIIHLPLLHPLLSGVLSTEQDDPSIAGRIPGRNGGNYGFQKRAPIAILSILSPDVPYPPNLINSLKALSPHLATSFHTSLQNTVLQERITAALYRQQQSGRGGTIIPVPINGLGLSLGFETLMQYDQEDSRSSTQDSLASPSDYSGYSGRSRHSPPESVVATPGLDPGIHFRNPTVTTPNQLPAVEPVENYFDVKKRTAVSRSQSGGPISQNQQAAQRAPSADPRSSLRKVDAPLASGEIVVTAKKESRKARVKDDKGEQSPLRAKPALARIESEDARHSVLHSYGADFSTSFQSLPVAAVPRTPITSHHGRTPSATEVHDMPPPSERLLRTIIDSLPVQIFTAAPLSGKVTWVNSKFLVYRGQTPRQVLDDPWEPIHPEDLDEYMGNWHRSLHTGQQFQHKARLRRFDDNYRWYYVRAAPLRDKAQNIVHWVGTMIDLHDQHVAEVNAARQQETAASEAKYRALANSSPQIVFAATKAKGITFCNSQWLAYSGQTEEQAKGTGFMEHVHPDDIFKCKLPMFEGESVLATPNSGHVRSGRMSRARSAMSESGSEASNDSTVTATAPTNAVVQTQSTRRISSEMVSLGVLRLAKDTTTGRPSYSTEVRLRMKSGEYRWHLIRVLSAEPLVSEDEDTWYGTCTDINDHKELEQTLKETMDAKSRFLSNMSHEIRTPLNGIAGMANFLIDSNLTPEQLDHVNVIRASTEGLRDLINDILDLSKVEAGMINLNMDWLHIRSVIEEVNDLTSSLALDKGLELNYLVEDNVPSMVKGDKFRFRQVLLNVIGNAIKFTPEGEVFTHCRLEPSENGDKLGESVLLVIDVVDTGRGFTEKEAERLFKRFSQIDGSSTRQHGGTGLGLVISMQLVELHGGQMSAKSVPEKGSTFTFSIRFGLPTDADGPPEKPVSPVEEMHRRMPQKPLPMEDTVIGSPGDQSPASLMPSVAQSPTFYAGLEQRGYDSPTLVSSAGSGSSVGATTRSSGRSSRSSQSSYGTDAGVPVQLGPIPERNRPKESLPVAGHLQPVASMQARVYSILVICPLQWTRTATVGHLQSVLDHSVPHMITSRDNLSEVRAMLTGSEPVIFSHIVLVLQDATMTSNLLGNLLQVTPTSTAIVIILDMSRKREVIANNSQLDFEDLAKRRRVLFIHKPVKPSRLAVIFDPEKSRELSTDQNQQSAQQIALSQKKVFDEMTRRLGSKNFRVLLVEDNKINQMVMLKLLKRVSVEVETCLDGVQATDKVLSKPPDYYSIILLDLMMPNKDGYQTCIDIRAWESQRGAARPIPIVALSANVLDDVWHKCRAAGFNSYLTKPVEFKELSDVMTAFLDPDDPSKPVPFMTEEVGGKPSARGR